MATVSRWTAGLLAAFAVFGGQSRAGSPAPSRESLDRGRELFHREWVVDDARSPGGDGLGPVYNDTSCVACHNLGATGGAGPASKNVDIVTAFARSELRGSQPLGSTTMTGELQGFQPFGTTTTRTVRIESVETKAVESIKTTTPRRVERQPGGRTVETKAAGPIKTASPPKDDDLVAAHPGFKTARSVVLHRFGADPRYETWRLRMLGMGGVPFPPNDILTAATRPHREMPARDQLRLTVRTQSRLQGQARFGRFAVIKSERNPTPLFGTGLIDTIPESVLERAAKVEYSEFPGVHGRVSRLKDGRIGRFGWKNQTASLADFVLTACAVELGLEVPGHHQSGSPIAPEDKASGLDLTDSECRSLVAFVGALPAPTSRKPVGAQERRVGDAGRLVFENVGCAACHTPSLGAVDGIYSDLLLHNMGPELGDTGAYGAFVPDSSEERPRHQGPPLADAPGSNPGETSTDMSKIVGATRQEWRTPPLWGVRDSGPYLHDGRAETLEQAIALHGGEGEESTRRYFELPPKSRLQLQTFLKTLVAPTAEVASLESGDAR